MKYYLKGSHQSIASGPFAIENIKAKLESGEIAPNTLAVAESDVGPNGALEMPMDCWRPLSSLLDFRPSDVAPMDATHPVPPPLPSSGLATAVIPISFCPFCGKELIHPPSGGEAAVCTHCGKQVTLAGTTARVSKPAHPAVVILTGIGTVLGAIVLFFGFAIILLFVLVLLFAPKCKA